MDFTKIAAAAAAAVEKGEDHSVAKKGGGGDYVPPEAGPTRLRFISYIELGKHDRTIKGAIKTEDMVQLGFELSGPKHPPKVGEDGTKHPHRIFFDLNKSMNEKATFFKLFNRMNYAGKAKHIAQLLGEAFKGTVVHRAWKDKQGNERIEAELKNADGFTIVPPRYEDMDTGEVKPLPVDPPISTPNLFLWSMPDMEQWASIFIDGEWDERKDDKGVVIAPKKSKNKHQNKIKLAKNFKGSPIEALLLAGGKPIDIPDAEDPSDSAPEADEAPAKAQPPVNAVPQGAAADDALAGVM